MTSHFEAVLTASIPGAADEFCIDDYILVAFDQLIYQRIMM